MSLKVEGAINYLTSNLSKKTRTADARTSDADKTNSSRSSNSLHRSSQEYLSNLKHKFSNMNIVVADFKSKNQETNYMKNCSGGNNIAISSKILERMANDPKTAEKYEKIIENVPNVINEVKEKTESDPDCKLLAAGAMIEEDGKVSYWTYTCSTTTVEVGSSKEKIQKHLEKNREKKTENKSLKKAKTEKTLERIKSERIKDISEQMNFLFSKGKSAAELFSNILLGKANIATGDIKSKSIKNLKLNIGRNLDIKL